MVHCGVPGGCYGCDLSGVQVVYTKAERLQLDASKMERHLKELAEMAGELKSMPATRFTERKLTELRETWVVVTRELKAVKAGTVKPQHPLTTGFRK